MISILISGREGGRSLRFAKRIRNCPAILILSILCPHRSHQPPPSPPTAPCSLTSNTSLALKTHHVNCILRNYLYWLVLLNYQGSQGGNFRGIIRLAEEGDWGYQGLGVARPNFERNIEHLQLNECITRPETSQAPIVSASTCDTMDPWLLIFSTGGNR